MLTLTFLPTPRRSKGKGPKLSPSDSLVGEREPIPKHSGLSRSPFAQWPDAPINVLIRLLEMTHIPQPDLNSEWTRPHAGIFSLQICLVATCLFCEGVRWLGCWSGLPWMILPHWRDWAPEKICLWAHAGFFQPGKDNAMNTPYRYR